jgi:thiosulfate dehydrogenase
MIKRTAICVLAAVGLLSFTTGCGILCALLGLGTNCGGSGGDPAEFTNASVARGGLLYDNWWETAGKSEPTGDHPLYPSTGQKSGSTTWRCKECHGWDYKGKDGAFATGDHATGIIGIFGTTKSAQEIFDLLNNAPSTNAQATPGHDYGSVLEPEDIWDLAKFVLSDDGGQYDTGNIIVNGSFNGDATRGAALFAENGGIGTGSGCAVCHDPDGKRWNFHEAEGGAPEYVGTVAKEDPQEFQHKVWFGQPGTTMPSAFSDGGTRQNVSDVGAHAQTLD